MTFVLRAHPHLSEGYLIERTNARQDDGMFFVLELRRIERRRLDERRVRSLLLDQDAETAAFGQKIVDFLNKGENQ
jgi:hypothetical protein